MAGGAAHETEIKLAVESADRGRKLLEDAGFHVRRPRVFEMNQLFDTSDGLLRQSRQLLRIRQVDEECVLTFKGTPEESRHKSREELELKVETAGMLARIFERLGYRPVFRYEKYRTEYSRPGEAGLATLDETPIGVFLELEGDGEWIDTTAREMGFGEAQYVLASYASLYFSHCAAAGVPPGEGMIFPPGAEGDGVRP